MTDSLLNIVLDAHLCNGCGGCVELCPELFRMDEAGAKAELLALRAPLSPALAEAIKMCARQCISTEGGKP